MALIAESPAPESVDRIPAGPGSPVLEARDLYRFFRAGEEETLALRGVSLAVSAGEILAVTGPSGSGKSTLLSCLSGVEEPDGGFVYVDGERLSHRPETERAAIRARSIGLLFQSTNLFGQLSILDNMRLAANLGRSGSDDSRQILTQVGLASRMHAFPSELSGGEAARAGLAVALANRPSLLIADEPTGELDGVTEARVLDLIAEHARSGCAVVIVTHSRAVVAHSTRILHLVDGRITS